MRSFPILPSWPRAAGLVLLLALAGGLAAQTTATAVPQIPFTQFTLDNGLRVILSVDHRAPVVTESMLFDVGGKDEKPGQSGFAHLFEHLMFEGSKDAPKGVFDHLVEGYGGTDNASTHEDYTFYFETAPSNALPILMWLDADRMAFLDVTPANMKNQIAVVEEEKRFRVDNQPYGPLLYVDITRTAFPDWRSAHPVIGSFHDLNQATLAEVKAFFDAYYAPSNCILTIVGDFDPAQTEAEVRRYFGWIPNRAGATERSLKAAAKAERKARAKAVKRAEKAPPPAPPGGEKDLTEHDPNAKLPALSVAWLGPPRGSPAFYALAVLGQDLFAGPSSRYYQSLVKKRQVAIAVDGGLGFPRADYTDYESPGLFAGYAIYKPTATPQLIEELFFRQIHEIVANGLSEAELTRVKTKLAADWIRGEQTTLDRAQLLGLGELLNGSPGESGDLRGMMDVSSAEIQKAAAEYLTHARVTVITDLPGAAPSPAAPASAGKPAAPPPAAAAAPLARPQGGRS